MPLEFEDDLARGHAPQANVSVDGTVTGHRPEFPLTVHDPQPKRLETSSNLERQPLPEMEVDATRSPF